MSASWEIREGDALERLREMPDESVQCCVTSPPYFGLRDYGVEGQIGLEPTPDEYVAALVGVFREVRRVLRKDGTLWLVIGDSYNNRAVSRPSSHQAGLGFESAHLAVSWRDHAANGRAHLSIRNGDLKEKDLLGVPWQLAFALRADGWYLRSDIIWFKSNPMPESVTDRPTSAHEHVFLLAKSRSYFYDADAIREGEAISFASQGFKAQTQAIRQSVGSAQNGGTGERGANPIVGRNKRNVWEIATQPYAEAHFATFPPKLVEPCVLAGCPEGGVVLDPFAGAGTTGLVALRHDRSFLGIELNTTYAEMARERIRCDAPLLNTPAEVAA